ncbi:tRNA lysidine(34) synthetase TilS [Rubrivivax sp. RP6-9]|uniref:tRNA lysidine(34) synthetase TilS n=1 Tax=Rubrivivax sp. RP6-9 TaxID=3415750 RepID=UPI003CC6267C
MNARAVAVAVSGGRDSTALLHAAARAAGPLGVQVHALHVHHGLAPQADAWLLHVQHQCRRWAARGLPVVFHATRLQGQPARGDSIEAWARRERYKALAAMARTAGCGLVLLAHHRRDQAETLLLQALRGGGPAGLAAMPALAERAGITWARPWLERPREAIEAYVRRHRLAFVDDASNADPRFARNRLRLHVWPALQQAFPDAEAQLQAAARRAQEAAAGLHALAVADLAPLLHPDGALRCAPWRLLAAPRRRLVLRQWLQQQVPGGVPESLVERLADELPRARSARWPAPQAELRLHDGLLRLHPLVAPAPPPTPSEPARSLALQRPGVHRAAGWGGRFVVTAADHGGIEPSRLRKPSLRQREGGEQFLAHPGGVPRSLKKQYQAARVPAWHRGGPLLFDGDTLVFVPGLGIDARCIAPPGVRQLQLQWLPDGAEDAAPAG